MPLTFNNFWINLIAYDWNSVKVQLNINTFFRVEETTLEEELELQMAVHGVENALISIYAFIYGNSNLQLAEWTFFVFLRRTSGILIWTPLSNDS